MTQKKPSPTDLEQYRNRVQAEKREDATSAGTKLFMKLGFTGATMANISKEASCSTATIYKHFGSKENLLAECVLAAEDRLNFIQHVLKAEGELILAALIEAGTHKEGTAALRATLSQFEKSIPKPQTENRAACG